MRPTGSDGGKCRRVPRLRPRVCASTRLGTGRQPDRQFRCQSVRRQADDGGPAILGAECTKPLFTPTPLQHNETASTRIVARRFTPRCTNPTVLSRSAGRHAWSGQGCGQWTVLLPCMQHVGCDAKIRGRTKHRIECMHAVFANPLLAPACQQKAIGSPGAGRKKLSVVLARVFKFVGAVATARVATAPTCAAKRLSDARTTARNAGPPGRHSSPSDG